MFTKKFALDALERAIKTFAQVILSIVSVGILTTPMDLLDVNWLPVIFAGGIGFLYSIVMSLGSSLKGNPESASLVK
jgi:hypothetical protein